MTQFTQSHNRTTLPRNNNVQRNELLIAISRSSPPYVYIGGCPQNFRLRPPKRAGFQAEKTAYWSRYPEKFQSIALD